MSDLKKKKILVVCPHPENTAPGQRLKYEQYFETFRSNGYEIIVSPFMTDDFWNIVYKEGFLLKKIVLTLFGYCVRFKDLFTSYTMAFIFFYGQHHSGFLCLNGSFVCLIKILFTTSMIWFSSDIQVQLTALLKN